jgi:hypothetical protein
MECGAVLDVCRALGTLDEARGKQGKLLLIRIVAMLTKLCPMTVKV